MTKWFCSCNAVNVEFANYCHNCKATRWTSIQNTTIDILKQQILDAENVIRELSFGEFSDCIGNRKEVAETYWGKYGKN